ncbi:MAG: tRNA adenosine(34) deaminase TadA [Vallitaleaceae bacterium]|jgi:tRNA(adenine34) deaminase|nr:tRNA adenosine(34) deaminase TadA [Vallitaleaceae bacterium]
MDNSNYEIIDITRHEAYMAMALDEAKKAYAMDEVPIGGIRVYKDSIIGRGYNRRNTDKNPLAHGELIAIKEASDYLGDWRLEACTMYITLEPCPMCAGAIVQSRIPTIVLGAKNLKSGSAGTLINLLQVDTFNHQVEIIDGVMEDTCKDMLQQFFRELREKKKASD